jgi:hypothetical protein
MKTGGVCSPQAKAGFFTITIAEIVGVYKRALGPRAGSTRFDQSSPAD